MKNKITSIIALCMLLSACGQTEPDLAVPAPMKESSQTTEASLTTSTRSDTDLSTDVDNETDASTDTAVTETLDSNGAIISTSDDLNVSFIPYTDKYSDVGYGVFMMAATTVSFPSDITPQSETVTEAMTQEELETFLFDRCALWGNDPADYSITATKENFEFHHDWYQNISYSGYSDMRYLLIESTSFDPKFFLEIDEDNTRFDKTTSTLYMPIRTEYKYSDYVGSHNEELGTKVDNESTATYCILAINHDKYTDEEHPILNLVLIKPE